MDYLVLTDLHTHTALSPCADDDMNYYNILEMAKLQGIRILGITDHNSVHNGRIMKRLNNDKEIYILTGAEISSRENIHSLCFVDGDEKLDKLDDFIKKHHKIFPNKADVYGNQYLYNQNGYIGDKLSNFLVSTLDVSIHELSDYVMELDGIFIPAHIDRKNYSLFSQMENFPLDLKYTCLGISRNTNIFNLLGKLKDCGLVESGRRLFRSSDAHSLEDVGLFPSYLKLKKKIDFKSIKEALLDNNITLFKGMNNFISRSNIED